MATRQKAAHKLPAADKRTKLCRLPADVVALFAAVGWAEGMTNAQVGETIIRECLLDKINSLPPAVRERALRVAKLHAKAADPLPV